MTPPTTASRPSPPASRPWPLEPTPPRLGYWIVDSSGVVHTRFHGDMGHELNGPVLDSIPTPSGAGYYMVASDGRILAFSDKPFAGSLDANPQARPIVAVAATG